ncbi:MAG TPA: hypothetical protein VHE83_04590 [Mycobacteriales bacterium]|nr:hypothetical protein [Mycobacteriales bacterium]
MFAGISLAGPVAAADPPVTAVPTGVQAYGSWDGISIFWTGYSDTSAGQQPSVIDVYRTTGGSMTYVGNGQIGADHVKDSYAPVGVEQTYVAVAQYGSSYGPNSSTTTATRTAGGAPDLGTINALSVDSDEQQPYGSSAAGTLSVSASSPTALELQSTDPGIYLSFVGDAGELISPGTYVLGAPGSGPYATLTASNVQGCPLASGSVTFDEAMVESDGTPDVLTGSFHFTECNGVLPVALRGVIRYHSKQDWSQGAAATWTSTTAPTKVGHTASSSATISNLGTGTLTMGSSTSITGDGAADWSVTDDGCANVALAGSTTCTVGVSFHPSTSGDRLALLHVPDDSAQGETLVRLDASGLDKPGPPQNLDGSPTQRNVVLEWGDPDSDGNSPLTGFKVYGVDGGGATTLLGTTGVGEAFAESAPPPGTVVRLRVSAVNDVGEGPMSPVYTMTVPHRELVYAADSGYYVDEIDRQSSVDPKPQLAVDDDADADDEEPSVSPDGTRVAFASTELAAPGTVHIWSTRLDGTSGGALTSGSFVDGDPAWSPDGTMIAFDRTSSGSGTALPSIYVVSAMGGTPRAVVGGQLAFHPSWTQDGGHLIVTTVALGGGTAHTVELSTSPTAALSSAKTIPGGDGLQDVAVSPDGTTLAASTGYAIVTLPVGGGPVTTQAALGGTSDDPAWTPDGSTIYFDHDPEGPNQGYSRLWSVPAQGGVPELESDHNRDEVEPTILQDDLDAPVVHMAGPASPSPSRNARIAFTYSDADTPIGSVSTRCAFDGGAQIPCSSPFVAGGLSDGAHSLVVTATDVHGLQGSATASWTVHATGPSVRLTSPTAKVLTTRQAHIAWSGTGADGPLRYDLQVQSLRGKVYSKPLLLLSGSLTTSLDRVFLAGEQCFSVRVIDANGATSEWSAKRCIAVPTAGRRLLPSAGGWTFQRATKTSNGLVVARSVGARVTPGQSVKGYTAVAVVARTCPGCGRVSIVVGGVRVGSVSLAGPTRVAVLTVRIPRGRQGAPVLQVASLGRGVRLLGVALLV